jgi:choline kinase
MRAIILAAGRGSRMKEHTETRPKCLLEVGGKALLDHQIDSLKGAGIEEIGIVVGYRKELVSGRGLVEFFNPRWNETNMVSSLECADEWLRGGPCLVSYSDIFYEAEGVRRLMECGFELAVSYDPNWEKLWTKRFGDPLIDAETFKMNQRGEITEIGNKPRELSEIQGQYMGLLRFTPSSWAEVRRIREKLSDARKDKMHMTGTLQLFIDQGNVPVMAVEYSGRWGEFDNAEDLLVHQELS